MIKYVFPLKLKHKYNYSNYLSNILVTFLIILQDFLLSNFIYFSLYNLFLKYIDYIGITVCYYIYIYIYICIYINIDYLNVNINYSLKLYLFKN